MGELIFIVLLVGGLIGMAVISGLRKAWWNMAFWIFIGAGLGGFELVSKLVTGQTISQHHWTMTLADSSVGFVLFIITGLFFIGVWLHLAWKWLKKIMEKG